MKVASKKNKKSDNQKTLTTALLIKALLDILAALLNLIDRYIE